MSIYLFVFVSLSSFAQCCLSSSISMYYYPTGGSTFQSLLPTERRRRRRRRGPTNPFLVMAMVAKQRPSKVMPQEMYSLSGMNPSHYSKFLCHKAPLSLQPWCSNSSPFTTRRTTSGGRLNLLNKSLSTLKMSCILHMITYLILNALTNILVLQSLISKLQLKNLCLS